MCSAELSMKKSFITSRPGDNVYLVLVDILVSGVELFEQLR